MHIFEYILTVASVVFFPAFMFMAFFANFVIRRLRKEHPELYIKVIGDIDDQYLIENKTIGFRHLRRLEALIFSFRYVNEIGFTITIVFILGTLATLPMIIFVIIGLILINI